MDKTRWQEQWLMVEGRKPSTVAQRGKNRQMNSLASSLTCVLPLLPLAEGNQKPRHMGYLTAVLESVF